MSAYLKLFRIRQWHKNFFVFIGVVYSGNLMNPHFGLLAFLAFSAFCLISSSVYIINDLFDIERDKLHPKKKERPLAKGLIGVKNALACSFCLGSLSFLLAFQVSERLVLVVLFYLLLNIAYSYRLKHVVILDVFCIATCFLLRMAAGTTAIGIGMSRWLMLCGMMVALFLGFAKRAAELIMNNTGVNNETRSVLENYKGVIINQLIAISATGVILSYSLYTMSDEAIRTHQTTNLIITVPIVSYAIFRYLFLLYRGWVGGSPARDIFSDKHIIASAFLFIIVTLVLIY